MKYLVGILYYSGTSLIIEQTTDGDKLLAFETAFNRVTAEYPQYGPISCVYDAKELKAKQIKGRFMFYVSN